jgi:hypothetical protein
MQKLQETWGGYALADSSVAGIIATHIPVLGEGLPLVRHQVVEILTRHVLHKKIRMGPIISQICRQTDL